MTIDTEQLRKLSVDDRLKILDAVWDSFAEEQLEFEVPESHRSELDRRLADEEANPTAGEPWESVKKRLMSEP